MANVYSFTCFSKTPEISEKEKRVVHRGELEWFVRLKDLFKKTDSRVRLARSLAVISKDWGGGEVMQIQLRKPACVWLKRRALACLFAFILHLLNCSYQAIMEVDGSGQAVKYSTAALSCRDVRVRAEGASASLNANIPVSLPHTKRASWCTITVLNEAFQCVFTYTVLFLPCIMPYFVNCSRWSH